MNWSRLTESVHQELIRHCAAGGESARASEPGKEGACSPAISWTCSIIVRSCCSRPRLALRKAWRDRAVPRHAWTVRPRPEVRSTGWARERVAVPGASVRARSRIVPVARSSNPLPLVAGSHIPGHPRCRQERPVNALTGAREKVANYPGVTVERKSGRLTLADGRPVEMVDLPGASSGIRRAPTSGSSRRRAASDGRRVSVSPMRWSSCSTPPTSTIICVPLQLNRARAASHRRARRHTSPSATGSSSIPLGSRTSSECR